MRPSAAAGSTRRAAGPPRRDAGCHGVTWGAVCLFLQPAKSCRRVFLAGRSFRLRQGEAGGGGPGAGPGTPGRPEGRVQCGRQTVPGAQEGASGLHRGSRGRHRRVQRGHSHTLGMPPSRVGTGGARRGPGPGRCSSLPGAGSPWARPRRLPHTGWTEEAPGQNRATTRGPRSPSAEQGWAPGPEPRRAALERRSVLKAEDRLGRRRCGCRAAQQGPAPRLTVSLGGAPSPGWGRARRTRHRCPGGSPGPCQC